MKGRDALKVDWDEGENRADSTETYWKRLETASARAHVTRRVGDVEAALSRSARRLSAEYRYSFQAHAPVEPMNCFADVRDGRCEIRVGTQAPNEAQAAAAKLLGIPLEAVTVHVTLLGGGFGRRLDSRLRAGGGRALARDPASRSRSSGPAATTSRTTGSSRLPSMPCRPGSTPRAG